VGYEFSERAYTPFGVAPLTPPVQNRGKSHAPSSIQCKPISLYNRNLGCTSSPPAGDNSKRPRHEKSVESRS